MSSAVQPIISLFRSIPDMMDGDAERRWLAQKLNMPSIAPQSSAGMSAPVDTSWHDQMVRDANKSFLPATPAPNPPGKLYQRGGQHGR